MYDVQHGKAMEPMKGKWDSSRVDLGFTELFCIPEVIAVFLLSCEMKGEPAFKSLQGNPAIFRVRASRGPFHFKLKTQGPSHIPIAEGMLLLRCLWIVGLPVQ